MPIKSALIAASLITMFGCASKETKLESELAPAAQAEVRTEKADNDNTKLNITVKHLAHPEKLSAGASQYVVWVSPEGSDKAQNVGALNVNKDLEGKHETTVPYHNFRVFVTPESDRVAASPTGPVVFDKTINR